MFDWAPYRFIYVVYLKTYQSFCLAIGLLLLKPWDYDLGFLRPQLILPDMNSSSNVWYHSVKEKNCKVAMFYYSCRKSFMIVLNIVFVTSMKLSSNGIILSISVQISCFLLIHWFSQSYVITAYTMYDFVDFGVRFGCLHYFQLIKRFNQA